MRGVKVLAEGQRLQGLGFVSVEICDCGLFLIVYKDLLACRMLRGTMFMSFRSSTLLPFCLGGPFIKPRKQGSLIKG